MSKTYRVGFASLVHDHVWGELQHWKAHPNVEIVAAAISTPNSANSFAPRPALTTSTPLGRKCWRKRR